MSVEGSGQALDRESGSIIVDIFKGEGDIQSDDKDDG